MLSSYISLYKFCIYIHTYRWSELTESLKFHCELAHNACAITEFRLLNGAPPIIIGSHESSSQKEALLQIFDGYPDGKTPLCQHINEIVEQIRMYESHLRSNGQKACLIIATDGIATDGNMVEAMRPLKDLPVWVVVRLCTDEVEVCEFWNNVDKELELEMDVLDDLFAEATEVARFNRWLTYCEPLHRIREFGVR